MGELISFYKITEKEEPVLIKEYAFEHPIYQKTGEENQPIGFKLDNIMGFIDVKMALNIVYVFILEKKEPIHTDMAETKSYYSIGKGILSKCIH